MNPPLVLALACMLVLLAGCSAIRALYGQAEHIVAWRLDDYFGLDEEQRSRLHDRFAALHAWHRRTELPRVVTLLGAAEQRVVRGPVADDIEWLRTEARARAYSVLTEAHPDIVALLASLSDRQVERAAQRFERDNRKYAREHGAGMPADEQRKLRADRDIDNIEHWSGPLSREQKSRVTALSSAMPLDADAHLRDRIRRQHEFLALLRDRHDVARFGERLWRWMIDWDAQRPRDLDASLDAFDRARAGMIVAAFALLDPAQRRRIAERVRWYADAMRDLAAGKPG